MLYFFFPVLLCEFATFYYLFNSHLLDILLKLELRNNFWNCSCFPKILLFQDPLASLSADMIARTYNIFSIILKYAVDMLTWDKEVELPLGLEPPYVHTHPSHKDGALTIYFYLYWSTPILTLPLEK